MKLYSLLILFCFPLWALYDGAYFCYQQLCRLRQDLKHKYSETLIDFIVAILAISLLGAFVYMLNYPWGLGAILFFSALRIALQTGVKLRQFQGSVQGDETIISLVAEQAALKAERAQQYQALTIQRTKKWTQRHLEGWAECIHAIFNIRLSIERDNKKIEHIQCRIEALKKDMEDRAEYQWFCQQAQRMALLNVSLSLLVAIDFSWSLWLLGLNSLGLIVNCVFFETERMKQRIVMSR